jgi:hypothetical protein
MTCHDKAVNVEYDIPWYTPTARDQREQIIYPGPLAARCCWITWSPRLYADLCWLVMWCFGCSNIWWVPKESPNPAARDLWFLEAQPSFRSKINKSLETPYFCFTVHFDIMQQAFVGGFSMASTRRVCLEHRGYHKISLFIHYHFRIKIAMHHIAASVVIYHIPS